MLTNNQDNQKFKLTNQISFIINNNSNVYITQNNTTKVIKEKEPDVIPNPDKVSNVATITINKGNTVSNILSTLLEYKDEDPSESLIFSIKNTDVVYGNSKLHSYNTNLSTLHETLVDYNFPAARYYVNGYKSNYAILLNDGKKPFWTDTQHGVLIDNITTNKISLVPTRLNGYTANVTSFEENQLMQKYNGIVNITNLNHSLTADFIFNLQLSKGSSISTFNSTPFKFSNITYLKINGGVDVEVTLKNVRYSLLNTESKIILQNSNIAVNKLSQISDKSYNAIISYNVESLEYKNYIYKGIKTVNITIQNLNKNVLYNTLKYQKQLAHPFDHQSGYISNLPVGAIIWYPQVWSAFNPQHDKNNTTDPRYVILRGEPNNKDWQLCDGREIPSTSLYAKIYGLRNTPNYAVEEQFYENMYNTSCWHYLTEPSVIQFPPSTALSIQVCSVKPTRGTDERWDDNKHKTGRAWVYQNLSGAYDLQMSVFGNWRIAAYVDVKFTLDFNQLNFPLSQLKEKLAIQFDSYCCTGTEWWNCWTGGYIDAEGGYLPVNYQDGVKCIGGWPQDKVIVNGLWADTVNVPKLALINPNYDVHIIHVSGNPWRLLNNTSKSYRAYYNSSGQRVNMWLYTGPKGKHDGRYECHDHIITKNLPYHLKTYQVKLTDNLVNGLVNAFSNPNAGAEHKKLTFHLWFQMGLPTTYGALRSKGNWNNGLRWATYRNRDNTENSAPYHQFWQADPISLFSNVQLVYGNIKMKVVPTVKGGTLVSPTYSWGEFDASTKNVNFGAKGKYYNFGLFRRLNPYIKINDSNEKTKITKEDSFDVKEWKNPVNVIKVRNLFNEKDIEDLNTTGIANNLISSCYCLNDWNELNNNIIDWNWIIERDELNDLCTKDEERVRIYTEGNDDNEHITPTYGDVYTSEDNEFTYIELLDNKQPKNLFDFNSSFNTEEFNEDEATEIDYTNINGVIDVTDQVSPFISAKLENDVIKYYYKDVDITSAYEGASQVVGSKNIHYDYINNEFYYYNNNNQITSLDNVVYWYDGYGNLTDILTNANSSFPFTLPNGSTVSTFFESTNKYFYYKKTKKIKVNINSLVLDQLAFSYQGTDITDIVKGNSFTYNDGDEQKEIYYSNFNKKYYVKNRINQYINFNIQQNTLHVYHDTNYNNTLVTEPNIQYTYYNIEKDDDDNYCIYSNINLIRLASNYKMLQNVVNHINGEIINDTINTSTNSLPVFYTEVKRLNSTDTTVVDNLEMQSNEIINNGLGIDYYYFLGTDNKVMTAFTNVSSYFYDVNYNSVTSGATINNYINTSTTFETITEINKADTPAIINTILTTYSTSSDINLIYRNADNGNEEQITVGTAIDRNITNLSPYTSAYLPVIVPLTASTLSGMKDTNNNPVFEQGDSYHLSTYLNTSSYLTSTNVNNQIYNYLSNLVIDLGNQLEKNNDDNTSFVNSVDELSAVQYEVYFNEDRVPDSNVNFGTDQNYAITHEITKL